MIRALWDWKESERRSNSFQLPHLSHAEVAATSAENALAAGEWEARHRKAPDVVRIGRGRVGITREQHLRLAVDQRIALILQAGNIFHARILLTPFGVAARH